MKTFEHEWIFEVFGGLAVYLFERQMLLLVEPPNPGGGSGTAFIETTGYVHGLGVQDEPSGSLLKLDVVMKASLRYTGSSTMLVTVSHSSPKSE